jgi:hypothetical protein
MNKKVDTDGKGMGVTVGVAVGGVVAVGGTGVAVGGSVGTAVGVGTGVLHAANSAIPANTTIDHTERWDRDNMGSWIPYPPSET